MQKVAIITGAGRGIGKAIAEHLVADNYLVAVADIDGVTAKYVSDRINALTPDSARYYVLDISEREAVFNLVDDVVSDFGRLDVFVNNAGIAYIDSIVDSQPDKVNRLLDVNLKGTFWGIQAAASQFIKQGDGGTIVNAASLASVEGSALQGAYSASKFAIRGLGQSAAKELAQYGITVNAYDPGIVLTPLRDYIDQKTAQIKKITPDLQRKSVIDEIAFGRPASVDEIADLVSFLVSPKAKYITGQSILIDGGMRFH